MREEEVVYLTQKIWVAWIFFELRISSPNANQYRSYKENSHLTRISQISDCFSSYALFCFWLYPITISSINPSFTRSTVTNGDDILFKPGSVTIPHYENGLLPEIYDKLGKLEAGATAEPGSAELTKTAAAKEEAIKASEAIKDDPKAEVVMAEG